MSNKEKNTSSKLSKNLNICKNYTNKFIIIIYF